MYYYQLQTFDSILDRLNLHNLVNEHSSVIYKVYILIKRENVACTDCTVCTVLYLEMISRTALTSASTAGESCAARAVRRWEMSQATDHWHRCSRNRSFQHSCSSSTCAGDSQTPLEGVSESATWSPEVRVWKGARHLAHLTAMKSSRAAVSCSVSQLVGSEGSAEGSSGGLSSCAGAGAGGGGKRFRFRSTPERKECGPNSEAAAGGASEERGDTGPGPGNTLLGNMEPEPNSEWPPGKRSGEGLE